MRLNCFGVFSVSAKVQTNLRALGRLTSYDDAFNAWTRSLPSAQDWDTMRPWGVLASALKRLGVLCLRASRSSEKLREVGSGTGLGTDEGDQLQVRAHALREDKFDISSPDKLVALATALVRRKVARQWRHVRRQQRLSSAAQDYGNLSQLLTSLSSSGDDPARAAQLRDQVENLCRHLDETQRRILELRSHG